MTLCKNIRKNPKIFIYIEMQQSKFLNKIF